MSGNQTMLWIYNQVMPKMFVFSIILSFISLACNTPQTFEMLPPLKYITLVLDIFTGIILFVESCFKIKDHGFIEGETPYMKTRWFVFEGLMVLFIWISVILQISEITYIGHTNAPLGLLRIPRALIMLRGFQYLNFQFESGRLAIIVVRSGHQIWGVTLFLLFFLLLYGLLGVQLFGTMSYHCVENGTDPKNVTLKNLAIPDTLCSVDDLSVCPPTFVCMDLDLTIEQKGFGGFDNIFISTKTVYEAASQEGWVFLMYKNIDSYQDWHGYLYFVTLIFFLAWLVKNVFIAVIIETFAEIRVQVNNIWGNTRKSHSLFFTQVIGSENEQNKWKIIDLETPKESHLNTWREALRSRWFHLAMLVAIVLNVSISAFSPVDSSNHARPWNFFRIAELFFTLVFDIEAVMKIICYGVKGYFKWNIYKYEAFLALVTTFNTTIYSFPVLRSFSVLRIIRLVKLSPTLENFVYKIFGPAKKIGLLVVFTLSILTLTSTISLQMLCYVDKLHFFSTFPNAFMSMFQIMTQEGWVDVMHEALILVGYKTYIPVSIYFILYHLFVTTVMISLFVAVILDNLELDESLKRMKQLKVTESSVDFKLPFRLKVFDSFPNKPQMVRLSKMSNEFSLPQVRESFLRQYADDNVSVPRPLIASHAAGLPFPVRDIFATSTAIVSSTSFTTRLAVQNDGLPNGYKNYSTLNEFKTGLNLKQRTRFCMMRNNDGLASFLDNFKNSDTTVEKRPNILNSLIKECSQTNKISENSTGSRSGDRKSILSAQNLMRRDRTFNLTNRRMLNNGKTNEEDTISNHQDSLFDCNAQHELDFKMIDLKRQQALLKREREEQELRENHPLFDTPLLFIKRESKFRRLCKYIVNAQYGKTSNKLNSDVNQSVNTQVLDELLGLVTYLDWLMISVTVASCSCMMLETTTTRIHNTPALRVVEYVFVFAIGLELLVKVCANGLLFTPKPAFKDPGGFLDVAIFLISLIFVCSLQSSEGHTGQALMVLRCLRPLKIFKLVPQIRKVVVELFRSIKEIVMVGILLVALMFVFASFGVQIYGGKLAACNDRTILNREDCHGIFFQHIWISNSLNIDGDPPGFMVPRVWTNPRNFNFNTIGDAMLALFEVLSLKGWIEVRDILVARMGPAHAIYIHLFVFLGCMMGLTLFIGVVIANYNENKGTALLTVDQRRWEDLKSRLKIAQPLHLPPRPPGKCLRAQMYDLAENPHFKVVIACCVLIRSLLLSWKWESSEEYAKYLLNASLFFTFIFVFEIIIKIIGMTFKGMLSSWRNRYDLVVTMMEIIWVVACLIKKDNSSYSTGWCLIVLRFFSICGKHTTLKMLLMTVAVSVYRSTFIIIAMFLLLLCYAYAGVVLFGTVKYGENIDRHANFATAPLAMTVLFRIVTGEDWNKIMHDCMIQPPRCTPGEHYWETDCGNVTAALIYFCSFYVIIAYIMLNLLVAIIVENFSLFYTLDEDILFSYNDLHRFEVTWNMVDVRRKGTIPVSKVATLLRLLKGRLRIDTTKDHILLKHMCYEMEKIGRSSGNKNGMNGNSSNSKNNDDLVVTFHDVLMMTAYRSVDIRKSLQLEELLMRSKLEAEIEEHVAKETIRKWLEKCVRKYKLQKSKPTFSVELSNDLVSVATQQPTIVTSQIDCDDITDEERDAEKNEFLCSLKPQKSGKSRKHGICKPPSSYLSASENLLRHSSLSFVDSTFSDYKLASSCHDNKPLSTTSDLWWNDLE